MNTTREHFTSTVANLAATQDSQHPTFRVALALADDKVRNLHPFAMNVDALTDSLTVTIIHAATTSHLYATVFDRKTWSTAEVPAEDMAGTVWDYLNQLPSTYATK